MKTSTAVIVLVLLTYWFGFAVGSNWFTGGADVQTVQVEMDADLIRYLDAHNCPLPEVAPHE